MTLTEEKPWEGAWSEAVVTSAALAYITKQKQRKVFPFGLLPPDPHSNPLKLLPQLNKFQRPLGTSLGNTPADDPLSEN